MLLYEEQMFKGALNDDEVVLESTEVFGKGRWNTVMRTHLGGVWYIIAVWMIQGKFYVNEHAGSDIEEEALQDYDEYVDSWA